MILLTKIDQNSVLVQPESIKYIESVPDTLIHFLNGENIIVRESLADIYIKLIKIKADILTACGANSSNKSELEIS